MENAPDDISDLMWSSRANNNDVTTPSVISAASLTSHHHHGLPDLPQQQGCEKMVKHGEILNKLDGIIKQLSSDTHRLYHDVSGFTNQHGQVNRHRLSKNVAKMTDNIERLQADENSLSNSRSKLAKNAYVSSKTVNIKHEKPEKVSEISPSASRAMSSVSKISKVPSSANMISGITDSTKNKSKLSVAKRISSSVFAKKKKETAKTGVLHWSGNNINLASDSIDSQSTDKQNETVDPKCSIHPSGSRINLASNSRDSPIFDKENDTPDPTFAMHPSGSRINLASDSTNSLPNYKENETADPKFAMHPSGSRINLASDSTHSQSSHKENETTDPKFVMHPSGSWINLAMPDFSHLSLAFSSILGQEDEPTISLDMKSGRDLTACTPVKSADVPCRNSPQKNKHKKVCKNPSFLSVLTHHPTLFRSSRSHCSDCDHNEFNTDECKVNVSFTAVDYNNPKTAELDRWAMNFSMVDRFDGILHTTLDEMFDNVEKKLQRRLDMKAFGGKLLKFSPDNKPRRFINNQISSINKEDIMMPLKGLMNIESSSLDHDSIQKLLDDNNDHCLIPTWLDEATSHRTNKLFKSGNTNKIVNKLLKNCSSLSFSDDTESSSSDCTSSSCSKP